MMNFEVVLELARGWNGFTSQSAGCGGFLVTQSSTKFCAELH